MIQYKAYSDCLGVRTDSKLSWNDHIKKACKSFNGKIKLMRHLRLPKEVLETLYFRTIIPSVTYGIAVWGSCSASLFNDLERIHIRAARLIHKIPKNIVDGKVLDFVGWNTLRYMYKKRILSLTHSGYYNDSIDEINNLVVKETTKYSFRNSFKIKLNRPRTEIGRRTFKHRAALAWNIIPDAIKSHRNASIFKKELKSVARLLEDISNEKGSSAISNKDINYVYY